MPKSMSDTLKAKKKKAIALQNLSKINEINKIHGETRGRKRLAKSMQIWAKMYLESTTSVHDFEVWRKAKPSEALPWAWKVVYGDGSGQAAIGKGQVNVLIQILTGQAPTSNVPRGTIDTPPLIDIVTDQVIDTPSIICNSLPDKKD